MAAWLATKLVIRLWRMRPPLAAPANSNGAASCLYASAIDVPDPYSR